MIDGIDLQALAREIAVRISPDALIDVDDVAALFKCCPRQVKERYAKAPGFPKSVHLIPGQRGQLKWVRADITAYIESIRAKAQRKPGRPARKILGDTGDENGPENRASP